MNKKEQDLVLPKTVSFESKNFPGYYLIHSNFRMRIEKLSNEKEPEFFKKDCSFKIVSGLADESFKSFESINYPGYYIRHKNFHLYLEQNTEELFKKDCTFKITQGNSQNSNQQNETEYISLQSFNYPRHFIRHRNYMGEITEISSELDKKDSSFKIVEGLFGENTVSFESKNFPGYYLIHSNFRMRIEKLSNEKEPEFFKKDCSFKIVSGLADESFKSFESINYPGYYIRHKNFHLYLEQNTEELFKKDCTFKITQGNSQNSNQQNETEYISLQSFNYPRHFIRHRNYMGEITEISSELDKKDSSFKIVEGLFVNN
ncbi:alpha-l-arabinofuranosidase b [Anaeramoeba flamelloides]|uniref:Alpha-l-arabinofuranosidase b n=1 Tax=Anaeramoeba flamelloides TaxID=1746091 RepID=A0AAV7Y106_9EUKA|nr:alpha-l-arabinofuranosidase b [Anaeramoeba flamelloides]